MKIFLTNRLHFHFLPTQKLSGFLSKVTKLFAKNFRFIKAKQGNLYSSYRWESKWDFALKKYISGTLLYFSKNVFDVKRGLILNAEIEFIIGIYKNILKRRRFFCLHNDKKRTKDKICLRKKTFARILHSDPIHFPLFFVCIRRKFWIRLFKIWKSGKIVLLAIT